MSITTHNAAGALDTPLALPSGMTIKNRLVKAAMSEQLARVAGAPTEALERRSAAGRPPPRRTTPLHGPKA